APPNAPFADSPSAEHSSPATSRAGCQAPDEKELLGQVRKVRAGGLGSRHRSGCAREGGEGEGAGADAERGGASFLARPLGPSPFRLPRQAIESKLKLSLGEDLGEALADGVVLCQLANRLCPRAVPFIHVPSPAVVSLARARALSKWGGGGRRPAWGPSLAGSWRRLPSLSPTGALSFLLLPQPKLNAAQSRKNLQSFLAACRRLGVPEVRLGTAGAGAASGACSFPASRPSSSPLPAGVSVFSLTLTCSSLSVFSHLPQVSLCGGPEIALLLQGHLRGFLGLLEALLPLLRPAAGSPFSAHLAGFGVFYACVMLLLYFAYCQLCGFFCCYCC
uniref:Calponin-homology (CH) domain-containing protein n=1 Tax=Pseudonaja textilis TaxID=8673 RepID=A0A670ZE59_PSETE